MDQPTGSGLAPAHRGTFGLTPGRVEAFSDGVFAIAVTLLILNVQVPSAEEGRLLSSLLRLWPEYATYAASFLTIGIMWLNHHALFSRIVNVDRPLVLLNLLLLMVVAFMPFPTEVLGRHVSGSDASVAGAFYALTAILIAVGFSSVYIYTARHPALLSPLYAPEDLLRSAPWFSIGLASYAACLPLALVSPTAVVVVIAATALYYAFDRLPGPRYQGPQETG